MFAFNVCKEGRPLACPVDAIGRTGTVTDGYTSLRGFSDLDDLIAGAWVVGQCIQSPRRRAGRPRPVAGSSLAARNRLIIMRRTTATETVRQSCRDDDAASALSTSELEMLAAITGVAMLGGTLVQQ